MKKLFFITLSIIVILQTTGCKNEEKNVDNAKASINDDKITSISAQGEITEKTLQNLIYIKIGWKFLRYSKTVEIDDEYPYTDVFLVIEAEKKQEIQIGSYMGNAYIIEDYNNRDLPENTLMACASWWAGGGDDICIVKKDNCSLSVIWRPIGEVGDDVEYEVSSFKEMLVIAIPENSGIEILPLSDEEKDKDNVVHKTGTLTAGEQK